MMDAQNFEPGDEQIDLAIANRLGKLRSMPVDTSGLERMLASHIPTQRVMDRFQPLRWFRPMRSLAASIAAIALLAALLVTSSGGPVLASATEMAQFHNDLVSGRVPAMRVDSVDAVNRAIAAQWAQSPQVPNMPDDHVMACCMRSVRSKRMVCVLLKGKGEPVTMTVANASDMQLPRSPIVSRNGVEYHVQSSGQLNMVMTERGDRWVCLIARMPANALMDLASNLQF